MFTNYGDKDFFENGCFVDTEHIRASIGDIWKRRISAESLNMS